MTAETCQECADLGGAGFFAQTQVPDRHVVGSGDQQTPGNGRGTSMRQRQEYQREVGQNLYNEGFPAHSGSPHRAEAAHPSVELFT